MIRIKVIEDDNIIKKVTLSGHANYNDYGKDIVCAAVSATYLCTINAILSLDNNSINVLLNDNADGIEVINYDLYTEKLLRNMIRCLSDLERQYPKNIQIR